MNLDDSIFGNSEPSEQTQIERPTSIEKPTPMDKAVALSIEATTPALTPGETAFIEKHIASGGQVAIVPNGSKAIIVRKEFNPEVKNKIEELTTELTGIGAVTSQEDANKANEVLAKAKKFIKSLEQERKSMTEVLDLEKKSIMNYEDSIVGKLAKYVDIINNTITEFHKEKLRQDQEREAALKKKRDEEAAAAQAEADRKAGIQKKILEFENSVMKACQSATIDDIDEKIKRLAAAKVKPEVYAEFFAQAEIMYQDCVTKMNNRKTDLMKLADLEKKNKEAADKLKFEQDEKARLAMEEQEQKKDDALSLIEEEKQNVVANSQMAYEFKAASGEVSKGVMKKWKFDAENIDMTSLPEEFKMPDEKKIKQAIAEGCRDIPGVRIYQDVINVSK
jgi:hypothetical protein